MSLAAFGKDKIDVSISGVRNEVANNIRSHLNLGRLACNTSEWHMRNLLAGADEEISDALRALGYYQATWQVHRELVSTEKRQCWDIDIDVTPGKGTKISALSIELIGEGKNNSQLIQAVDNSPLKVGERIHHGKYEQAKKLLRQAALSQGFFNYQFTVSRLAVDRLANTATVSLTFDAGERSNFGQITIADTPLNKQFISRYLRFTSGDPFDAGKLIRLQNSLINSRYFEQVNVVQSEPDPVSGAVDIDIQLSVKERYESTFGVGYSTDLGPRINYQLRNRRFNAKGDTYQLTTQFSPAESQINFQYQQPGADPINEKTLWSLGWQREDNDTYTSDAYNAEVSRIKVYDNGWARTLSLNLLVEDFDIASEADSVVLLYPGISWQKTRSNDHRYPTKGWRLATSVRGSGDQLISSTAFAQAQLDTKAIFPLFGGRVIGRSTLGATLVDDFQKFPASLRFYAGGDNSVRGFDYQSLGPTDDNDEVIGGKHLLAGSVEYDHRVYKDYSLAVFYDAGNAFDTDAFTLYESVGFGVRWHSPIGTIRLDLAFPLESSDFQFHISMGPDL